jgi:hypothetical protein
MALRMWVSQSICLFLLWQLVRVSDGAVVATFRKKRWSFWNKKERKCGLPNKSKRFVGTLDIKKAAYDPSGHSNGSDGPIAMSKEIAASVSGWMSKLDAKPKAKNEKYLNPNGTHAANLTEDAIVVTAWIVTEAEHRLRWKLVDLLLEIAQNAGGG